MSGILWGHIPETSTRKADLVATERANQVTHGFAAFLAAVAVVVLIERAWSLGGDALLIACCLSYSVSQFLVYLCSTLSHSYLSGYRKHTFRTLDQVSIFLMIAGGYTPVGLLVCGGFNGVFVVTSMWILALAGIAMKVFVRGIQNVPVWYYVIVGWLPLLNTRQVIDWFPAEGLFWVVAGGASYTIGTYFLLNDSKGRYYHPTWHVLVIAGSACHFWVMYHYVVPGLTAAAG